MSRSRKAPGRMPQATPFRPPAVPLVAVDPYFSVWSFADRLTDDRTRHWTGASRPLCGMARIDGKTWRFAVPHPENVPAMDQKELTVLPTRTIYRFEAAGIEMLLTFTTPALPDDLDVFSWPVTYVAWDVRSLDGSPHAVTVYFDVLTDWVVNYCDQRIAWGRFRLGDGLNVLRAGSQDQPILEKRGDDLRIDWGHLYLAVPREGLVSDVIAEVEPVRSGFAAGGKLPDRDDLRCPRPACDGWPAMACVMDFGRVSAAPVSRYLMLAYDDIFSIEYMDRRLRPYWSRAGRGPAELLLEAARRRKAIEARCRAFDSELAADLRKAGGGKYADLCALAYRQCVAAHKLAADFDGSPMHFSKENFSNGCISTVDVIYPAAPFFLLFNTDLLRAQLTPVLDYARSPRWRFPFAPHDLGTYPLANGQVYGGGEKTEHHQMPVEETANMLLLVAAMAKIDRDDSYARKYWPLLTRWAEYLLEKGFDPENQLCTDDFAGHLAHNTNLSIKAILALGAYATLADRMGDKAAARAHRKAAAGMAAKWAMQADDGDRYRLAFDKPGTWSQKYNLVWDRLLGLRLFPAEIARRETAFYLSRQNEFGVPLDSRKGYTKLDWTVWSATLAESREDFEAIVAPMHAFADRSPDRVPLGDWFETESGKQIHFRARSVVGGIFIKMLDDPATWRKWASRPGKRGST